VSGWRWIAGASLAVVGACAEEQPADPAPETSADEAVRDEPEPPPEAPAVDALDEPSGGEASLALPRWSGEHRAFVHEVGGVPALYGRSDLVSTVLLGESEAEGVVRTFYGSTLEPGESYDVLPATDETRSEHVGRDSGVWTAVVGHEEGGDLRSVSGSVTIASVGEEHIAGTLEAPVQNRMLVVETPVRARFRAAPDDFMNAQLSHEQAVRHQLKHRGRRRR